MRFSVIFNGKTNENTLFLAEKHQSRAMTSQGKPLKTTCNIITDADQK